MWPLRLCTGAAMGSLTFAFVWYLTALLGFALTERSTAPIDAASFAQFEEWAHSAKHWSGDAQTIGLVAIGIGGIAGLGAATGWIRQWPRALHDRARRTPELGRLGHIGSLFIVAWLVLLAAFAFAPDSARPPGRISEAVTWATGWGIVFSGFYLLALPLFPRRTKSGLDDIHGTARFATAREVASLEQKKARDGLIIGRNPKTGRLIYYPGNKHALAIAPTRAGKGVGLIIPNLLLQPRAFIVIDPKGEAARLTADARRTFGPVHILDPFGVAGGSSAFDPVAALAPASPDLLDDVRGLADALILHTGRCGGEEYFDDQARALLGGLIEFVVRLQKDPSLPAVRALLTLPKEGFEAVLEDMARMGGSVGSVANQQRGRADREASAILSSAQRHTHFLDSPRLASVLGRADFAFADLRRQGGTVFLVLPPDRMGDYNRWQRVIVTAAVNEITRLRMPESEGRPVTMLLDEFGELGRLAVIEQVIALGAGSGLQAWPIVQDLSQLKALYGDKHTIFFSGSGVRIFFGVTDEPTAELVSKSLGTATMVWQSESRHDKGKSEADHVAARPLLTPDEVKRRPASEAFLFVDRLPPILARKVVYHQDKEFRPRVRNDRS